MFSWIDMYGTSASSWWMITMPFSSESRIVLNLHVSPLYTMSPSYVPYGYTPDNTFIKVDLPAPFSPQIENIWPLLTMIFTSFNAVTGPKRFTI